MRSTRGTSLLVASYVRSVIVCCHMISRDSLDPLSIGLYGNSMHCMLPNRPPDLDLVYTTTSVSADLGDDPDLQFGCVLQSVSSTRLLS